MTEDLSLLEAPEEEALQALDDRVVCGIPPYPVSLAAEINPLISGIWSSLGQQADPSKARQILGSVRDSGSFQRSRARIAQSTWAARCALRSLPPSAHRDAMENIAIALAS